MLYLAGTYLLLSIIRGRNIEIQNIHPSSATAYINYYALSYLLQQRGPDRYRDIQISKYLVEVHSTYVRAPIRIWYRRYRRTSQVRQVPT